MTFGSIVRVAVVAASLGLDVFAVSVGVGMRGAPLAMKARIGVSFAIAEVTMAVVGAGLGALVHGAVGEVAGYLGFGALVLVGAYMIVEALRQPESGFDLSRGWGLLLASLSISLDSLGIGFSIWYIGVPIAVSLLAIALASISATTLGLSLGQRLGHAVEEFAGLAAGVVLVLTGLVFAALKGFGLD